MIKRLTIFLLLFTFNNAAIACGTAENWMDAYEGIESKNEWRDSMNRLETLVMLSGCGGTQLDKQQQLRLSGILVQALEQEARLRTLPSSHDEISDKLKRVRSPLAFDSLIETIYRRFNCLSKAPEPILREHFGTQLCPGEQSTTYVHESILNNTKNLFECRTGEIIGSDVSGFFTLEDSATAKIDWFDKDESKLMSCDLSIAGAKYNARAHSNDITFEFKKQACESNSEKSPIRLAVMNDGFLRISNRTTGGYISHLLLFSNAQPLACEIEKIDRKRLEQLASEISLEY